MNRSGARWWGIALIVIGAVLFLGNYYDLDVGRLIHTWWPLFLVVWGVLLILRHNSQGRSQEAMPASGTSSPESQSGPMAQEHILQSSVFGDTNVRISSQSFKGGTISTVFGDSVIDLSNAGLSDGEQMLKVSGVFGNTTITLPRDMAFSATVNTVFGDAQVIEQKKEGLSSSISFQVPEYASATKKLRIHSSQVFGDIVVRR